MSPAKWAEGDYPDHSVFFTVQEGCTDLISFNWLVIQLLLSQTSFLQFLLGHILG